jgi:hypothetical protein
MLRRMAYLNSLELSTHLETSVSPDQRNGGRDKHKSYVDQFKTSKRKRNMRYNLCYLRRGEHTIKGHSNHAESSTACRVRLATSTFTVAQSRACLTIDFLWPQVAAVADWKHNKPLICLLHHYVILRVMVFLSISILPVLLFFPAFNVWLSCLELDENIYFKHHAFLHHIIIMLITMRWDFRFLLLWLWRFTIS